MRELIEAAPNLEVRAFAVVPTYNRPEVATRSVEALLNQTRPLAGVILVENAEQPHFEGRFPADRVEVVRPGYNLGSAGGYALGTDVALERGATHVMLVDDDCLLNLDVFEKFSEQLERTPDAALSTISTVDGTSLTWTAGRNVGGRATVADLPAQPFAVRGAAFHGFLLPAQALRSAGGPRGDFFIGAEDVELCRRLNSKGVEFYCCPDARAQHHAPPFRDLWFFGPRRVPIGSPGHRYYVLRNRLIIWRLYHPESFARGVVLTVARELTGALTGGRPWRRLRLLAEAMRDGLLGDPHRRLRTDVSLFN